MGFPLSWNIDAEDLRPWLKDNDYAGLKAHLQAVNPTVVLVMNGLWLAVRIKNEWLPDCIVIHRDYSIHEGGEWLVRYPRAMVEQWKREGHKEIVRYLTNEPGVDIAHALAFAAREAETMKLAREAGFTVVALNTSVGTPEPELIEIGRFDVLLIAAVEYEHYLGCHEYYTLCLPASLMGDEALLDKNALQPANWPREKITVDTPGIHYLFRSVRFVTRCKQLGIGIPKFIHTEFGYDDIRNAGNGDVITDLRERYGMPRYNNDMRGVNTHEKIWNDYYPGVEYNQVIRQQLQWWLGVKPDWIIGACLFGINSDWDVPHGHDWSADVRRGFFPVLEEMSKAMTELPTPEITYDYKPHILDVKVDSLLIRSDMSRASDTLGKFTRGSIGVFADINHIQQIGGYSWLPILYETKPAFVARYSLLPDNLSIKDLYSIIVYDNPAPDPESPVKPPIPDPEPPDDVLIDLPLPHLTLTVTEANRAQLAQFYRTQAHIYSAIADALEAPSPTTAQIAADVYDKNNDVEAAMLVKALTDKA